MPPIPCSDPMACGANDFAFRHFQHHSLEGFSAALSTDCEKLFSVRAMVKVHAGRMKGTTAVDAREALQRGQQIANGSLLFLHYLVVTGAAPIVVSLTFLGCFLPPLFSSWRKVKPAFLSASRADHVSKPLV